MKKAKRLLIGFIFAYVLYAIFGFLAVLKKNYDLGWPLDMSELIWEPDPDAILDEWVEFKRQFKEIDYTQIDRRNYEILSNKRKTFMRHSIQHYNHQYYHSREGIKRRRIRRQTRIQV